MDMDTPTGAPPPPPPPGVAAHPLLTHQTLIHRPPTPPALRAEQILTAVEESLTTVLAAPGRRTPQLPAAIGRVQALADTLASTCPPQDASRIAIGYAQAAHDVPTLITLSVDRVKALSFQLAPILTWSTGQGETAQRNGSELGPLILNVCERLGESLGLLLDLLTRAADE